MKKIIVFLLVLCLCIGLCSCVNEASSTEKEKMSTFQARSAAVRTILDAIDEYYDSNEYLDLSKTTYEIETVKDLGLSYRVSGTYYLYWTDGKLFADQWFGATVNAYTGSIEDITIFGH